MNENLITYKKLSHADISNLTELVNVYSNVFEMENFSVPNKEYLQTLLDKDNIVFCVALLDNVVIGGLTAYLLPSVYYTSNQVYIYDLAVTQNRQRQGIGKNIISFLKNYCEASGHKEMYVQADFEDENAIEFYKSTGGRSEKVIHFSYDVAKVK